MKTISTITPNHLRSTVVLVVVSVLLSASVFAGSGPSPKKLEFKNPTLKTGTAGQNGAVYEFPKVTGEVNAMVKIVSRSSPLVNLINIDLTSTGSDKAWQPQVGYNNNRINNAGEWWMEFQISFIDKRNGQPVSVDAFDLSAVDIDGNGDKIREFVSFYNLKSYTVEKNSILSISNILGNLVNGLTGVVAKRFDGPTLNMANIDTAGTSVMVTANYENVQTFTVRLGGVATAANSATDRMYSMNYQSFKYVEPADATLPIKLTSFDTKLNNSNVAIDWATSEEINFSHFLLERSANGNDFKEIAIVFADVKENGSEYSYKDIVSKNTSGLLYYRLKMVDRDGSFKYSNVRIVKLGGKNNTIAVNAYPNPATSEVRITIPTAWQNKQVVYEMINLNGVIVKQQVNIHASQTETIQVSNLQSGNYVVRLKSGDETAIQMIAKN